MSKGRVRVCALTGTFPGPSRTITVEPIKVPRAPAVVPTVPRELPAPAKPELPREPAPTR